MLRARDRTRTTPRPEPAGLRLSEHVRQDLLAVEVSVELSDHRRFRENNDTIRDRFDLLDVFRDSD